MSEQLPTRNIFDEVRDAGNKSNLHDISIEMADEPVDSDLHEETPPLSAQPPAQETALLRARFKQPERHADLPVQPKQEGDAKPVPAPEDPKNQAERVRDSNGEGSLPSSAPQQVG